MGGRWPIRAGEASKGAVRSTRSAVRPARRRAGVDRLGRRRAPRAIGPGHSPVISPRGDTVAYLLGDQIWTAPLAGGPPAQLIHDRGRSGSPAWSPGSKLAFRSWRAAITASWVFIVAADKSLSSNIQRGSSDRDYAPEWSPDSRSIAFIRIAAGKHSPFADSLTAQPWSIWTARRRERRGAPDLDRQRRPGQRLSLAGDRTPAAVDRDRPAGLRLGAHRLAAALSVPAAGGAATQLTNGEFELFTAELSEDRKRIVYSSNQGDIDHRHIWEVAPEGGPPRQLTRGATIEDNPVVTSDGPDRHPRGRLAPSDPPGGAGRRRPPAPTSRPRRRPPTSRRPASPSPSRWCSTAPTG